MPPPIGALSGRGVSCCQVIVGESNEKHRAPEENAALTDDDEEEEEDEVFPITEKLDAEADVSLLAEDGANEATEDGVVIDDAEEDVEDPDKVMTRLGGIDDIGGGGAEDVGELLSMTSPAAR